MLCGGMRYDYAMSQGAWRPVAWIISADNEAVIRACVACTAIATAAYTCQSYYAFILHAFDPQLCALSEDGGHSTSLHFFSWPQMRRVMSSDPDTSRPSGREHRQEIDIAIMSPEELQLPLCAPEAHFLPSHTHGQLPRGPVES